MVTIGVEQQVSIRDLDENQCLENIKKLQKYAGKGDDKQQYKDIIEATMVYTTKGTTEISKMSINTHELKKIMIQ